MSFESVFELVSLGDVALFINGDRSTNYPKGDDYVADGIPFISAADLSDSRIQQDHVKRISNQAYERLRSGKIRNRDILFCLRGSIGKLAFVHPNEVGAIASSLVIVRSTEKIDSYYLYYVLGSQSGQQAASSLNNGSAQPNLSVGELQKVKIPLPSISKQHQITSVLKSFDDRITLLRETNKTLEAIAQALFKSWFVDFDPVRAKMEGRQPEGMDEATAALFPDSFEESELGFVPKGWRVLPFLEVCEMQGGAQPPASEFKDEPREGYVRLLQIRDFSTDAHKTYVPLEKKLKTATDDDVLIGRYGSASGDKEKDSLGRVCRGLAGAYNVALMKLVPLLVGREFALQLVDDPRFYQYLQGVSSKAVQSGFSKKELAQYKVAVPSGDLCDKYELFGSLIWKRSKKIKKQIEILSNIRDTLLPRLISGQLPLPEAEAEIEALTA